jgi:hypothetical protein
VDAALWIRKGELEVEVRWLSFAGMCVHLTTSGDCAAMQRATSIILAWRFVFYV